MARQRRSKRAAKITRAVYDSLMTRLQDTESRLRDAETKAELWDKIVEAVRDSVMPDIEEKVTDAVEDAVSGLSIS